MTALVTAGVDGSEESEAAVRHAAREAVLREVPLRLMAVDDWPGLPEVPEAYLREAAEWRAEVLREAAEGVRKEHAGLEVRTEQPRGRPAEVLTAAADASDLTVLGSRGLGGIHGFVVGSVSLAVVAAARTPVVLVRRDDGDRGRSGDAGTAATPDGAPPGDGGILVGLDLGHSCDPLLSYAFAEAARTGRPVRFLHGWTLPAAYGLAGSVDPGLGDEMRAHLTARAERQLTPWRAAYAGVTATAEVVIGSAAYTLVEATRDAGLVIVGRRRRRLPVGPRLGHVAHAVIHHSPAPVTVVPLET